MAMAACQGGRERAGEWVGERSVDVEGRSVDGRRRVGGFAVRLLVLIDFEKNEPAQIFMAGRRWSHVIGWLSESGAEAPSLPKKLHQKKVGIDKEKKKKIISCTHNTTRKKVKGIIERESTKKTQRFAAVHHMDDT